MRDVSRIDLREGGVTLATRIVIDHAPVYRALLIYLWQGSRANRVGLCRCLNGAGGNGRIV